MKYEVTLRKTSAAQGRLLVEAKSPSEAIHLAQDLINSAADNNSVEWDEPKDVLFIHVVGAMPTEKENRELLASF
jgi:hypothetical protein